VEQGKILKVTLEFENITYIAEGKDAQSWSHRINTLETLGFTRGLKGWDQWTKKITRDNTGG
jgi:hypothetical protein